MVVEDGVQLILHELLQDFCRYEVQGEGEKEKWHLRLLQGHMPSLSHSARSVVDFGANLHVFLNYSPQLWGQENLIIKRYILRNLTKHLLGAGLVLELWAIMFDPKWICSQFNSGGKAALDRDFKMLELTVAKKLTKGISEIEISKSIQCISKFLKGTSKDCFDSASALFRSALLPARGQLSRVDSLHYRMQNCIVDAKALPCSCFVLH